MTAKKVAQDRWRQAQEWEFSLWNRTEVKKGWRKYVWPFVRPFYRLAGNPEARRDDHNYWWAKHFDDYSFLPDSPDNYIVSPYTSSTRKAGFSIFRKHTWI